MFILVGAAAILWLIFQGFVLMFYIVGFLFTALFRMDKVKLYGEQATGRYGAEDQL